MPQVGRACASRGFLQSFIQWPGRIVSLQGDQASMQRAGGQRWITRRTTSAAKRITSVTNPTSQVFF